MDNFSCENGYFELPLLFHECIYTYSEFFAFILGYSSICFWLFAQIPQLVKNFQYKKYINIKFILIWLLGDICNLIGSRLTQQKPFQIYLAAYFVIIDTALLSQCVYYRNNDRESILISDNLSPSILSPLLLASPVNGLSNSNVELVGTTISWICCILYLTSRLPQIHTNFQRKSVQNLSMTMFACALAGNLTYSMSVLLTWEANKFPFLLGSLGTIGLDLTVFLQYFLYKDNNIHSD
eukprot:NODE_5_length_72347_cov_1.339331.p38 type:complete len:238 gc:universal NODE_5_length_72347_cov_1.339331:10184-9471(-)